MTSRFTYSAAPFVAAAALTLILTPTAADATEKPANITAVWWAQGTDQWPTEGQTLAASRPSDTLDVDFIQSEAAKLGCGFTIQGDLYADDKTTKSLLEGGKLYGPSNPTESWPGGEYRSEFSTVFYTGDCPPPVEPPVYPGDIITSTESGEVVDCELEVVTREVVHFKQVGTLNEADEWIYGEPVETGRETFTRTATEIECPPVVVPPVDPPVEPPVVVDPPVVIDPPVIDPPVTIDPPTVPDPPVSTPPALVTTGVETDALGWSAALLAAGIAFILWARNRNRIANLKHRA